MTYVLGTTRRGHEVSMTAQERSWHTHILGGTGRGKSSLLESSIRQDIKSGRGLCLIDKHGTLSDQIVEWCASRRFNDLRRIHVIEASDLAWSASFNPLRLDGFSDPSVRVDAMVSACAQVWAENSIQTPLIRNCLTAVFYALAVRRLTLVEATELVNSVDKRRVRRRLTENLPDYVFESLWENFNAMKPSEFEDRFSSATRRLTEFLKSPVVRRILGQTHRSLDLKQIMDGREILIVNLAGKNRLSPDSVRVLGTLLTSEMFLLAKARDKETADRRPFTLYIDECSEFVTDDVERMLDETRKFGLHVVLAHQRLAQLRERSEKMFEAVMGGAHTKIVFGGLRDNDAEIMAREVYRATFNLQRPKHILDKPIVTEETPYWLDSESDTNSSSTTVTRGSTAGWTSGTGTSAGASETYGSDPDNRDPFRRSSTSGTDSNESRSDSSHESLGETDGYSHTSGRSQTLKPVRVMMPTAVHSLEEELHLAIVKLRDLPQQAAIVKRPDSYPVRITPLDVHPAMTSRRHVDTFRDAVRVASPFTVRAAIVDAEIAARIADLRREEEPVGDDEFYSEDVR